MHILGGGLKVRGDHENMVLKDRPDGFEGGDYVFFGFQGYVIQRSEREKKRH